VEKFCDDEATVKGYAIKDSKTGSRAITCRRALSPICFATLPPDVRV